MPTVATHVALKVAAPSAVRPTLIPVLAAILVLIVRAGLSVAIKVFGKTSVKKALKSKLLSLNANKWHHIMASKHNWHKLGAAGNKDKIADYLSQAVLHGKRTTQGSSSYVYTWVTKGKTVVATVSRHTGEISNGWVK